MKRGELTSSTIITTILIIAAFVILLIAGMAMYNFYNQSTPDELCRLSILERATVPSETQTYIPLKCSTKKICLSLGGSDKCDQFLGEKDYLTIKLDKNNPKESARMIEETITSAQYACWSLTGKGYIDLTSGISKNLESYAWKVAVGTEGNIKPACLVCSRVAFSEQLQENKEILPKVDVFNYMKTKTVPLSNPQITYLQAFTDQQITDYSSDQNFKDRIKDSNNPATSQLAIVFTQVLVDGKSSIDQAIEAGASTGVAIGGGLLLTPAGRVVSLVGTLPTLLVGIGIAGGVALSTGITASDNQALAVAHCGELRTSATKNGNPEKRFGCTAVMPVDYNNITKINNLCAGGILGSP